MIERVQVGDESGAGVAVYLIADSEDGDCYEAGAWLVLARSPAEAARLVVAVTRQEEPPRGAWRTDVEVPTGGAHLGLWDPPDPVWVSLGIAPSEEYALCWMCGRIVHDSEWAGDNDECDACSQGST